MLFCQLHENRIIIFFHTADLCNISVMNKSVGTISGHLFNQNTCVMVAVILTAQ